MGLAGAPRHLIDRLPSIRGRLTADAPLGAQTWFRVGGSAEVLARPADAEDLARLLAAVPAGVPVTVIGVGSNLLVRDGGVEGLVVRLAGAAWAAIEVDPATITVIAGAGALDATVAETAAAAGIGGLAFLCGIPGTMGGAVAMNAGAYGRELKDVLLAAELALPSGRVERVEAAGLGLGYRSSRLPPGAIVTRLWLQGQAGEPSAIAAEMAAIRAQREASQPVRARTGGSTFRNPPGEKAWALIDRAGCRGLRQGGAEISPLHCNFLINLGEASAADLEGLGETVRARVLATSGIDLQWEIRRIGRPAPEAAR